MADVNPPEEPQNAWYQFTAEEWSGFTPNDWYWFLPVRPAFQIFSWLSELVITHIETIRGPHIKD